MAQITWNQMQAPDFKAANALLLSGQDQFNTAIGQAGKVVTDYQAANTKNNTQAIMNALQSAKSPEEYQAALESAQAIAATKSGDFDQDKFNAARLTQPGVLDAQQQQDWARKDRDPLAEAQRIIMSGGKPEDIAALNFQSDAARIAAANMYQQGTANMFAANKDVRETADSAAAKATADAKLLEEKRKAVAAGVGTGSRYNPATGKVEIYNPATEPVPSASTGNTSSLIGSTPGQRSLTAALADPNSPTMRALPTFAPAIAAASSKYGIAPELFTGLLAHESNMGIAKTAGSKTNNNSVQMILDTQKAMGVTGDMQDPMVAVDAAGRYLTSLKKINPKATDAELFQAYHDGHFGASKDGKPSSDPTYGERIVQSASVLKNGLPPSTSDAATTITTGKKADPITAQYQATVGKLNHETDVAPITLKVANGLNDIKATYGIKEEAGDTATNDAKISKYLADNKTGILGRLVGLNSNPAKQLDFANEVPGFSDLPSKTRLAILSNVNNQNKSDTYSWLPSLSKDEMKDRFRTLVSAEVERQAPQLAMKQEALVENGVNDLKSKLAGVGIPDRMTLLTTVLGDRDSAKRYLVAHPDTTAATNTPPTPAQAAGTIAAGKPAVKEPVVTPPRAAPKTELDVLNEMKSKNRDEYNAVKQAGLGSTTANTIMSRNPSIQKLLDAEAAYDKKNPKFVPFSPYTASSFFNSFTGK